MEIELLRPAQWVARNGLAVSGLHFTNIEELELRGFARVSAIEACPPLAVGDGAVVTGRYVTRGAGKLVRVRLDDGSDLVGTAQHPIWSESRRAWTPLGELLPGEHLRGRSGPLAVLAVTPLPGVADVYNLEIHGQHVYAITPAGVLVHNAAECAKSFDFNAHLRKVKGPPPADMIDPHAHHILFKKGNRARQQALVEEGQAILRRANIDPICGKENLAWAPWRIKGQHGLAAVQNVVDKLRALEKAGGDYDDFVQLLRELGQVAADRK